MADVRQEAIDVAIMAAQAESMHKNPSVALVGRMKLAVVEELLKWTSSEIERGHHPVDLAKAISYVAGEFAAKLIMASKQVNDNVKHPKLDDLSELFKKAFVTELKSVTEIFERAAASGQWPPQFPGQNQKSS